MWMKLGKKLKDTEEIYNVMTARTGPQVGKHSRYSHNEGKFEKNSTLVHVAILVGTNH